MQVRLSAFSTYQEKLTQLLGSGIGRQVALKMAEHGASTVICAGGDKQAIEETSLLVEQQQRKLGITVVVSSIVVDIRSEESVKTMFERSRELEWRIDIVVYAAHVSIAYRSFTRTQLLIRLIL